jgi:hypothetical protein
VAFEIVLGGPAESKGAKRAVAPEVSAQLGQENEVRMRLRETNVSKRIDPGSLKRCIAMPTGTTDEKFD